MTFTIYGQPYSKANRRRPTRDGRFIKSKEATAYAKSATTQLQVLLAKKELPTAPLEGDVKVTIVVWYASRRPDLDESLILDLLQGFAYANDRQVKEKHIYWALDRDNPRATITVEPRT